MSGLHIWKEKKQGGIALILGLALTGPAQALVCVADTQCRGDAERMCAPSTLRIEVTKADRLWIDRQGPYGAVASRDGDARVWTVEAFGSLALRIEADGTFLYRGNRGKRFTGTCREAL